MHIAITRLARCDNRRLSATFAVRKTHDASGFQIATNLIGDDMA
ncbi:hypothetical protein L479_03253 [Exiguobacterium sp. S17]|nr:hypothetical protein L479_03253 [Exiguobacterium sp. S17]